MYRSAFIKVAKITNPSQEGLFDVENMPLQELNIRRFEDAILDGIDFGAKLDAFTSILTEREFEVTCARAQGVRQWEIADNLGVSDNRIFQLMDQIRKKAATIFDRQLIEERSMQQSGLSEETIIYRNNG